LLGRSVRRSVGTPRTSALATTGPPTLTAKATQATKATQVTEATEAAEGR